MNPAKCDEALLILYEEKLFFVLCVAIIRPSTLLGDEHMGDGKFIPHLPKKKIAHHDFLTLMQPHSVTAVESYTSIQAKASPTPAYILLS